MKLEDGTSFSLGTGFSDRERENPPAIGSKVTFRYQELTDGGVPRFPSFVRVYEDIDQKPTKKNSRSRKKEEA
jgi:DNA ligase-1